MNKNSNSVTVWLSDSDVCEQCDGLLDWMGQCPHCGWDGMDCEEDDDWIDDDYSLDFDEQGRYIGG